MTPQSPSLSTRAEPAGSPPQQPADAGRSPVVPLFLAVTAQLALILLTIHLFKIEPNLPFFAVMGLVAGGFAIHAWLPQRFRLGFFCLLSLTSTVLLLGWQSAGWLLGLGGGLIALCHLPVPWVYRLPLIAVTGGVLAWWRSASAEAFWPILGSMFMFRLIVYLYDRRRERHRPPLLQTLAYFFTLPNLCFLFFPIIDFKTFRQTYYNDEPYTIYQTGVAWIVRGLTHLLVYRIIKYYLLPAPHQVTDLPQLLLFLAANYALYLRVSGWFHIITGMLHLYGFNLPRTHHNYFLASSVSDVWRRINIYWKDFMAKLFFYPAFFALRGWGRPVALATATLWVFVVTWLLHSYQVFWLRGELPLSFNEALLWLFAGVAVTINVQFDLRGREGEQESQETSVEAFSPFREARTGAILALRIIGTFLLVSLFWACWTMPQFPSYLYVLATSGAITPEGVGILLGMVAAGVVAGMLIQLGRGWLSRSRVWLPMPSYARPAVLPAAVLLVLVAAAIPQVDVVLGTEVSKVLATLRLETATPVEAALAIQGYYEQLADTPLQASPLLALPEPAQKKRSSASYTDMTRPADDFLERELIPGWSGEILGYPLSINSLGMRDREGITREKPAGVCRLAFVGSSVVMGYGVGDEETFTRLLEKHLNAERAASRERPRPEKDGGHIEVLNFGTGKSRPIQRRTVIERKVFAFHPDALYYVAHQDECEGIVRHLTRLLERRNKLPDYLRDIVQQAGIDPEAPPGFLEVRLQLFAPQILRGIYAHLVQQCRQRGIVPVWVSLPLPEIKNTAFESSEVMGLAEKTGFVVLNLDKWDAGYPLETIRTDAFHPNALGHQLLAERLRALLRERPDALPACARP